jgi:methylphosphonate synthase
MKNCADPGPTQAIILAAGCGSAIKPFTDYEPKAFVPVAGVPMIQHTIKSLRHNDVSNFTIVRGHNGEVFTRRQEELGPGVSLVTNADFAQTSMFHSFLLALPHAQQRGFYVAYGDVVFAETVSRALRDATGDICVVVDRNAKMDPYHPRRDGRDAKDFSEIEGVSIEASNIDGQHYVTRIGKGRCGKSWDDPEAYGEFAGLMKFSQTGAQQLLKAITELGLEFDKGTVSMRSGKRLPWYMQPLKKAKLCDLLQHLIDMGLSVTPVEIFGNCREVDTTQDLLCANNSLGYLNHQKDQRQLVAAMGAALLSEANDLKRPLDVVAKELNLDISILKAFLAGAIEPDMARVIVRKMTETYPVSLNDLWIEHDDTSEGARIHTSAESEASARLLERAHPSASPNPAAPVRTEYYEYRDSAMSRNAPFRPEWIKVLRQVQDSDPDNRDVQMNNGHLMMQMTFFIGPVNFYWVNPEGKRCCKEMNTGDSNFIAPFVPHSFANRDATQDALIIAVTYGSQVKQALSLFGTLGGKQVGELSGNLRDSDSTRKARIKRQLDAECMTTENLMSSLSNGHEPDAKRARALVEGAEPSPAEAQQLASVLNVKPADLAVSSLEEDVNFSVAEESARKARLCEKGTNGCIGSTTRYELRPLVRNKHQPDLKSFDALIVDGDQPGPVLQVGLHQFVYNHGTQAVEILWGEDKKQQGRVLYPGDSAYVAPLVPHCFACPTSSREMLVSVLDAPSHPNGSGAAKGRRLLLVRIPGSLTTETLNEFSLFRQDSWPRVGRETMQWYK